MRFQPSPETSEKSNSAQGKISSAVCASSTDSSRVIEHPVVGASGCSHSDNFTCSTQAPSEGFPGRSIFSSSSSILGFASTDLRCTETTAFVVFMVFIVSQCVWMEKVVSWRTCYWLLRSWPKLPSSHLTSGEDLVSLLLFCAGFASLVWGSFTYSWQQLQEKNFTGYKETLWSAYSPTNL